MSTTIGFHRLRSRHVAWIVALPLVLAACDATRTTQPDFPPRPNHPARDVVGFCSPCQLDPGWILFSDTTQQYGALYKIRPDGTNQVFLGGTFSEGSWMPDYVHYLAVHRMGAAPTALVTLSDAIGPGGGYVTYSGPDDEPQASPDGSRVAYRSTYYSFYWPGVQEEIYSLPVGAGPNETGRVMETTMAGKNRWPSWSPNGYTLVFASTATSAGNFGTDGGTFHIWRTVDPTWAYQLTTIEGRYPTYSPDGKRIAFATLQRDGTSRIAVMNADGTNVVVLSNGVKDATQPSWSRDGQRIAFASSDPAFKGINVMNADGTNVQHVVSKGSLPKWSR